MDTDKAPRKMRFAPKAPPTRDRKPVLPKVEKEENDNDTAKRDALIRLHKEASLRGRPKVEKKDVKVALGFGGSSSFIKKDQGPSSHGLLQLLSCHSSLEEAILGKSRELLDEEEFGENPQVSAYDECEVNPTEELGLLDENTENSMIFFQLPTTMPTITQPDNDANATRGTGVSQKPCNLESLPAGLMGKMLVYRSGAVKLKLGETLYDVSSGLDCVFAQDVVAVNIEEKHCCNVAEINKRAVVTPDIDSMLADMSL
ncbi:hypothetical protein OROHE_009163 [Orobanche hederae]